MRDTIKGFLVFLLVFIVMPVIAGTFETHYNKEGVVIAVQDNEILVEDTSKNVWTFEGTGFDEGDRVKMRMFTNCTDSTFEDDEIEKVEIIY